LRQDVPLSEDQVLLLALVVLERATETLLHKLHKICCSGFWFLGRRLHIS